MWQFVLIAFAIGQGNVDVMQRKMTLDECDIAVQAVLQTGYAYDVSGAGLVDVGDKVPACVPDTIDF